MDGRKATTLHTAKYLAFHAFSLVLRVRELILTSVGIYIIPSTYVNKIMQTKYFVRLEYTFCAVDNSECCIPYTTISWNVKKSLTCY